MECTPEGLGKEPRQRTDGTSWRTNGRNRKAVGRGFVALYCRFGIDCSRMGQELSELSAGPRREGDEKEDGRFVVLQLGFNPCSLGFDQFSFCNGQARYQTTFRYRRVLCNFVSPCSTNITSSDASLPHTFSRIIARTQFLSNLSILCVFFQPPNEKKTFFMPERPRKGCSRISKSVLLRW